MTPLATSQVTLLIAGLLIALLIYAYVITLLFLSPWETPILDPRRTDRNSQHRYEHLRVVRPPVASQTQQVPGQVQMAMYERRSR